MKMSQNRKSFTLIELLLYMAIFSILLVVITELFLTILDTQLSSQATSQVEQDESFLIEKFTYDLRRAQNVLIPAAIGISSDSLQITIDGVNYSYVLDNNDLKLTNGLGTNQLNSINTAVSNLNFLRLGNLSGKNTIKISFTIESKTKRGSIAEVRNYETTVGIR